MDRGPVPQRSATWLALSLSCPAALAVGCGADPPLDVECIVDADCDDTVFCNGQETCDVPVGECVPSALDPCDDGVACTEDICGEETESCSHEPEDMDEDGFPALSCEDADGTPLGDDCDDTDPGSTTLAVDEDCDGYRDEVDPAVCATLGERSVYTGPVPTVAWSLDDGSARDDTLPAVPGTLLGAAASTTGILDRGAVTFDATVGTRIEAASLDARTLFTMAAWVRVSSYSAGGATVTAMGDGPASDGGVALSILESGELTVTTNSGVAGGEVATTGTSPVPLDEWTHVAATYDGDVVRLYRDGAEVANTDLDYVVLSYGTNALVVGVDLDGDIDEVGYWQVPLTEEDLAELVEAQCNGAPLAAPDANSCAPIDATPEGLVLPTPSVYWTYDDADLGEGIVIDRAGSFDGTIGAGATPGAVGIVDEAMRFDRTQQLASTVESDAYDAVDDFTLSLWLRPATMGDDGFRESRWLAGAGNGPNNSPICTGWAATVNSAQVRFAGYVGAVLSDCNAVARSSSRRCVVVDEWVHFAAVWDTTDDRIAVYRNGRLEDVADMGGRAPSNAATHSLHLGGPLFNTQGDRYYDGLQDEMALYHQALGAADIQELYALGRAGMPAASP